MGTNRTSEGKTGDERDGDIMRRKTICGLHLEHYFTFNPPGPAI